MFDRNEYGHLKGEAEHLAELEDRVQKYHKHSVIDPNEIVGAQPRENYRAPFFLSKTATPKQVTELNELLEELWSINEHFIGERVAEVSAYYAMTGEHLELEHALLTWCDGYMRLRADPSRITAQVENSPFVLAERLVTEWYSIFGKVYLSGNSIASLFLYVPTLYTRWLLYDRLWKHLVTRIDETRLAIREVKDVDRLRRMGTIVTKWGWLSNDLVPLLHAVKVWAPAARLAGAIALSHDVLRARIRGLASDIHEMRPLLVRNFHSQKTVTVLSTECAVAWEWRFSIGIAVLISGRTVGHVLKHIETVTTHFDVNVGYDGLFFDPRMPWYTPADLPVTDGVKPMALNYLLLERFHDLLYSFYEKIDFGRIRSRHPSRAEEPAPTAPSDPDDEAVTVACHTLAEATEVIEDDDDADSTSVRRIPVLRLQRVLRLFENRLGCEVGHGKGSEVNVYRPGGKIYTLGAHKRNREVHPLTVRRMLKVLEIPVEEFHAAVFG